MNFYTTKYCEFVMFIIFYHGHGTYISMVLACLISIGTEQFKNKLWHLLSDSLW